MRQGGGGGAATDPLGLCPHAEGRLMNSSLELKMHLLSLRSVEASSPD